jgi:hypothetical protein
VPPLSSVVVPGSVAVVVVEPVVDDSSVVVVVVVGVVVLVVLVLVAVVAGVVVVDVDAVVGGVVVVALDVVALSSSLSPIATRATPNPTTAATRTAMRALTPVLIPWRGGSPDDPEGGGTSMRRVGSSCTRAV